MLRLFRRIARVSLWFETRFTTSGRIVIGAGVAAAIFGVDPRQTLAFELAAILFGILFVALVFAVGWRPRLEISRQLPDTVTVDTATSYTVWITNHSTKAEHDLVLADRLLTRYPTPGVFRQRASEGRDAALNWFDRRVGFPRWLDLVRSGRGARLVPVAVPPIPAHTTVKVTLPLKPLRRGKLIFTELEVKRPDPLGIFFAKHRCELHGEVVALPKRYQVPRFQWVSQRHFHRGGVALAATVGDSEEFIGLRDYRPGDPLRHMHWRSFAKRGVPIVKEHQDEFFDRHALVIDTFAGEAPPDNFEAAIALAASFIQSDRPSDSILDLVFIEQRLWRLTTGRGLSNNRQILLQLAELQASSADEFDHVADYLRRYLDRLASIILVGTTWDAPRQTFVEELHERRINSLVLQVGSPEAAAPASGSSVERATRTAPQYIRPALIEQDIATLAVPG